LILPHNRDRAILPDSLGKMRYRTAFGVTRTPPQWFHSRRHNRRFKMG
jgi:hypothetical protein